MNYKIKIMKRVLLFLLILGLMPVVAFGQKRESRPVSNFTGIDASSVFDITVTKGNTESLAIETDDNVMPYVRSEVRDGVLHLYLDGSNKLKNITGLKAFVVMKNLDKASLSGACKLTANDTFTPDRFLADCSGASNMTVNVNTGQLSVEASGASNITINASVSGGTKLVASGASKIRGKLNATNVVFNSSGVCSLELTGSATDVKMGVSGSSKVKAEDFTVKNAVIVSSGTSKVTVNVTNALKVTSSGAASVYYKGSPTIEISSSKAAKVKKL